MRGNLPVKSGDELTGIANAITEKYPSRTTRDAIEAKGMYGYLAQPELNRGLT